jgi:hypothetical protein
MKRPPTLACSLSMPSFFASLAVCACLTCTAPAIDGDGPSPLMSVSVLWSKRGREEAQLTLGRCRR